MREHADDLDGLDLVHDLVDQAMLNVDPARTGAFEITDQHFMGAKQVLAKAPLGAWQSGGQESNAPKKSD